MKMPLEEFVEFLVSGPVVPCSVYFPIRERDERLQETRMTIWRFSDNRPLSEAWSTRRMRSFPHTLSHRSSPSPPRRRRPRTPALPAEAKCLAAEPPKVRDGRGEEVALYVVEYQRLNGRWHPHSIVTESDTWDAYWSRAYGLLVHASGSGLHRGAHWVAGYAEPKTFPGRLWTAPGVSLTCWGGERRPEKPLSEPGLRQKGLKRFTKLPGNPFDDARWVAGHVEYCCICRDYLPDDDNAPCLHLQWDDVSCQCVGSGVGWDTDRTATVAVSDAIPILCDKLLRDQGIARVERLRQELSARHMRGSNLVDWNDELGDEHRTAEAWLDTLHASSGVTMRDAIGRTLKIVDAWIDARKAA